MADKEKKNGGMTRKKLVEALNEDLSREYQAIISYVNYSQVLKGAAYMNVADELAVHAKEELDHALQLSNHIDYLGGMPSVVPKTVRTSEKAEEMLRFDLENERETIRNYRRRVKQADELNEFATAISSGNPAGAGISFDCAGYGAGYRSAGSGDCGLVAEWIAAFLRDDAFPIRLGDFFGDGTSPHILGSQDSGCES